MEPTVAPSAVWPLVVYIIVVIAIVIAMVAGSAALGGSKKRTKGTNNPIECGIYSYGNAHYRVPIPFFLFAIFFVIFDLEAVFLFTYAIAFREVGWAGYIEVLVFIGILVSALVYLWRLGALDWRTKKQKEQQSGSRIDW